MPETIFSLNEVKEYLSGQVLSRGIIVAFLVKSLLERYGDEVVEAAKKANYEAGKAKYNSLAQKIEKRDLKTLAYLMTEGPTVQQYGPELVKLTENECVIHWKACPIAQLAPMLKNKGFPEDFHKTLCSILEYFDHGAAEAFNPEIEALTPPEADKTGLLRGEDYCEIIFRKKRPK